MFCLFFWNYCSLLKKHPSPCKYTVCVQAIFLIAVNIWVLFFRLFLFTQHVCTPQMYFCNCFSPMKWMFNVRKVLWVERQIYWCVFAIASSLGKRRSAHSVVGAHAGLQARNHPHRLRRRPDHHLPDEKPHVLHSDHEKTAGMSLNVIIMTLRYIIYRNNPL